MSTTTIVISVIAIIFNFGAAMWSKLSLIRLCILLGGALTIFTKEEQEEWSAGYWRSILLANGLALVSFVLWCVAFGWHALWISVVAGFTMGAVTGCYQWLWRLRKLYKSIG